MTAPGIRRLMRGGAIYAAGSIANRLVSLVLLPIFTAYMAPSEFGALAMLTALSALFVPVFSLGFGVSIGVCYFGTTQVSERRSIIWSAGWVLLASALVLALGGWILREKLGAIIVGNTGYALHAALAFVLAAVGVLSTPWQLRLQFEERPGALVAASLLGVVVTAAASLWLVMRSGMGAAGALVGACAGQLVTLAASFFLGRDFGWRAAELRHVGQLVRHGLPMIPSFCFLFVLQQGARWPLEWTHGLDAVGIYSVGASLGSAMGVLTAAFSSAWMPFALRYADRREEAVTVLGKVTLYFIVAFGFATSLFFLFASPLVALLAEQSYGGAAAVVGLSAASQFFLGLFTALLPPLYFAKRVDNVIVTQAIATAIACALAFWLIPAYGVIGAGAAVTLSCLALVVVQWAALRLMPVIQIRYDLFRIGAWLLLFSIAAWLSFKIQFSSLLAGLAQAGGVALATGLVVLWGMRRIDAAVKP